MITYNKKLTLFYDVLVIIIAKKDAAILSQIGSRDAVIITWFN